MDRCHHPGRATLVHQHPSLDVIDGYDWELYNVEDDFSEANNLAGEYPERLAELKKLFYAEAAKYRVMPLDNDRVLRLDPVHRPSLTKGRTSFTYYPGARRIPEGVAPDIKNKSWQITAVIDVPVGGAEGMIATLGGLFNGWGLYLQDSTPIIHYNFGNVAHYQIASPVMLPGGQHTLRFDFDYDGGGIGKGGLGTLYVDDQQVAQGRIEHTVAVRFTMGVETFSVGEDTGTPVTLDYDVPFRFTGTIDHVTIDLAAQDDITAEHAAQAQRRASYEEALRE